MNSLQSVFALGLLLFAACDMTSSRNGSPGLTAPSGLKAEVLSSTELTLSWTDNSDSEDSFVIERSLDGSAFEACATAMQDSIQYTDSGLVQNTLYYYRLKARISSHDSAYSNVASARTPDIADLPEPPAGLAAEALSPMAIDISWQDNSSSETFYRIERRDDTGNFFGLRTVGAGAPVGARVHHVLYFPPSASPQAHDYRVRACNSVGCSAPGNEVSAARPAWTETTAARTWPTQTVPAIVTVWSGDRISAFSVTVDDNTVPDVPWWQEQISDTSQLRSKYRFTWFVITDYIDTNPSYFGTWEIYSGLAAEGHDIQSHTLDHLHGIEDGTYTIDEEYADSLEAIEDHIPGHPVTTLAYPGAEGNDKETAKKYYIAARGTVGLLNQLLDGSAETDWYDTNVGGGFNISNPEIGWCYIPNMHVFNPSRLGDYHAWQSALFHGLSDEEKLEVENGLDYMEAHDADIWFGLYRQIVMYGQERDAASLVVAEETDQLTIQVTDSLDSRFTQALGVKVRLGDGWSGAHASRNGEDVPVTLVSYGGNLYAVIETVPGGGNILLMKE